MKFDVTNPRHRWMMSKAWTSKMTVCSVFGGLAIWSAAVALVYACVITIAVTLIAAVGSYLAFAIFGGGWATPNPMSSEWEIAHRAYVEGTWLAHDTVFGKMTGYTIVCGTFLAAVALVIAIAVLALGAFVVPLQFLVDKLGDLLDGCADKIKKIYIHIPWCKPISYTFPAPYDQLKDGDWVELAYRRHHEIDGQFALRLGSGTITSLKFSERGVEIHFTNDGVHGGYTGPDCAFVTWGKHDETAESCSWYVKSYTPSTSQE